MTDLQAGPGTARDFLGRQIGIGDRVVWPGRQSSSLWMNVGTVTKIIWHEPKNYWFPEGKGKVPRVYVDREEKIWKAGKDTGKIEIKETHVDVIERMVVVKEGSE